MMILKRCLVEYFPIFRERLQLVINKRNNAEGSRLGFGELSAQFYISSVLSAILTQDITMALFASKEETISSSGGNHAAIQVILQAGSSIGSALTIHGNIHSLLIFLCFAYDKVSWTEFLQNITLPVLAILLLCLPVLYVYYVSLFGTQGLSRSETRLTHDPYQLLSTDLELTEIDQALEQVCHQDKLGDSKAGCFVSLDSKPTTWNHEGDDSTGIGSDEFGTHPPFLNRPYRFVIAIIASMITGYAMGGNVILVTTVAVLLIVWVGRLVSSRGPNLEYDPFLSNLDYEALFLYIGIALMTLALTDTGVPQACYVLALGEPCSWEMFQPQCMLPSLSVTYVFGVLVSPLATSFMLAGTFPYLVPYDWIQLSFILSMSHMTRSVIPPIWRMAGGFRKWLLLGLSLVLSWMFLGAGTFLLYRFHSAFECSVRLGECDGPYRDGPY